MEAFLFYRAMKEVVIAEESMPAVSFTDSGIIEHVELDLLNIRRETVKKRGRITLRKREWENVCVSVNFHLR